MRPRGGTDHVEARTSEACGSSCPHPLPLASRPTREADDLRAELLVRFGNEPLPGQLAPEVDAAETGLPAGELELLDRVVPLDVAGRGRYLAVRVEHLGNRRRQLARRHEGAALAAPAKGGPAGVEGDLLGERRPVAPERVDVEDDQAA